MQSKRNPARIVGATATLLAGILFLFCLIYSGGSGDENGRGAVWWLFVLFGLPMLFVGPLLLVISITKVVTIKGRPYRLGPLLLLALLILFLIGYFGIMS